MKQILVALAVMSYIISCTNKSSQKKSEESTIDLKAIKKIIDANNIKYVHAFLKGDSSAFAALHHSDIINMPPNEKIKVGRGIVSAEIKTIPKSDIKTYKVNTVEIIGGPEYIIERGTYEVGSSIEILDEGKYIVTWKQENNSWKIYRCIWNSDLAIKK